MWMFIVYYILCRHSVSSQNRSLTNLTKSLSEEQNASFVDMKHDHVWYHKGVTFVKHKLRDRKTKKILTLYERVDPPEFYDISNMTYDELLAES